jgi:hypothetical protein
MFYFLILAIFIGLSSCSKKNTTDYSSLKPNHPFGLTAESFISFEKPVGFSTAEGRDRLKRSTDKGFAVDFYNLVNFYAPQAYPVTCGPASLRIVLSALYMQNGVLPPISKETTLLKDFNGLQSPHFVFTEKNLFDKLSPEEKARGLEYDVVARQKAGPDGLFGGGIAVEDLRKVAISFEGIVAESFSVAKNDFSANSYNKFKTTVVDVLRTPNKYLIVNYFLPIEIPITSGHYSPVVAFDEKT